MFTLNTTHHFIEAEESDVLELYRTSAPVRLDLPGHASQLCHGYLCVIREDDATEILAALYLQETRQVLVYTPEQQPKERADLSRVLQEGTDLLCSFGLSLDKVNLSFGKALREVVLRDTRVIRPPDPVRKALRKKAAKEQTDERRQATERTFSGHSPAGPSHHRPAIQGQQNHPYGAVDPSMPRRQEPADTEIQAQEKAAADKAKTARMLAERAARMLAGRSAVGTKLSPAARKQEEPFEDESGWMPEQVVIAKPDQMAAEQAMAKQLAREQVAVGEQKHRSAEQQKFERLLDQKSETGQQATEHPTIEQPDATTAPHGQLLDQTDEAERFAREKALAEQVEQERLAAEKSEMERLLAETAEAERLAREKALAEQAEQERLATEKSEMERLLAQTAEAERLAREKAEAEHAELKRLAAERIAAIKTEAEQQSRKRIQAEEEERQRLAAEKAEMERLLAESAEAERKAQRKAAQEQAKQERLAAEKAEMERLLVQKTEAERLALERTAAEQAEWERRLAERLADEKAASEKIAREQAAREQAERERLASEKAEIERLLNEKVRAEQEAQKQASSAQAELERLVAEKAELEALLEEKTLAERCGWEQAAIEHEKRKKLEAEKEETERLLAEKAEAERLAREQVSLQQAEKERLFAELQRQSHERAVSEQAERDNLAAERAKMELLLSETREAERLAREKAAKAEAEKLRLEKEIAARRSPGPEDFRKWKEEKALSISDFTPGPGSGGGGIDPFENLGGSGFVGFNPSHAAAVLFIHDRTLSHIEYNAPEDIMDIYCCANLIRMAPEGYPMQGCSGYICSLIRNEQIAVEIGLLLVESTQAIIYRPDWQPDSPDGYAQVMQDAIAFLETVGFIVDPFSLSEDPAARLMELDKVPVLKKTG